VPRPRREANGLLWLRSDPGEAPGEAESLRLQVFRRIQDGIPVEVETRLELEVSGRGREVELSGALLDGSVPLAVAGDLPAQLDANRRLRVQVRGGRFEVRVRARVEGSPETLRRPDTEGGGDEAAWPEQEVWVFAAEERLRQVELSGPPGVDPSRTELPGEWQALPAFLMGPDAELALAERRRGQPAPPPDALTLSRELWLDPSGEAFTVRDRFGGRLGATTRLAMLAPAELGRAVLDGEPQLVTGRSDAAGVELRRQQLQLVAEARLPRQGALAAVGWGAEVESLGARLHLPPGWSLLAASGVDELPGTWASRWDLMSFFFVLLVGFAALKAFGPRTALVALLALILAHDEPGAPWLVWLSLLAATGLRIVAGGPRLAAVARVWWLASAAVLLLQLVPFAATQLRVALFPQTEELGPRFATSGPMGGLAGDATRAPAAPAAAPREREQLEEEAKAEPPARLARSQVPVPPPQPAALETVAVTAEPEQEPQAVLQTGPGVPGWQWRSYRLSWSGPVSREHRFRLLLVSPALSLVLTLLRLALLLLLAARLLAWPRPLKLPGLRPPGGAAAAAFGALLLAVPAPAAEPPSPQLLEELRQRLTRPAPCEPSCVSTPRLALLLRGERLSFEATVHAAALGSWPVPGPAAIWTPASVSVDGTPSGALARLADGFLHLRLPPGVHRVEVAGPVPAADSFTLQFGQLPRRARVDAAGWDAVGFRQDAPPDGSVQLARRLQAGASPREAGGEYPPWLEITRTLQLGVTWTVTTEVRRVSPPGSPVAVRVPLLPGEAPSDAALEAEEGEVAVALGRDQVATSWRSTLERAEELRLVAPEGRPWSEVWRLQCGPIWACAASGLAPLARWSDGRLEPEYRPWPGESLAVDLEHPEGVAGPSLTIDQVELEATPGIRLETASLSLRVRSSREQPLQLGLPDGAELKLLSLDGAPRDERPDAEGRLRVSVPAGSHRLALTWHRERGLGIVAALPEVTLPDPAVDAKLTLELPPSRWLLLTWGPSWGPAVLFWGYLLFVLAAAAALSRLPHSPLSTSDWLLLGLGLSQIGPVGGLLVAGFFLAVARRGRDVPAGALAFDVVQLALLLWALVAVGLLYDAVQTGLLFRPDMQVSGGGSSDTSLRWYADRLAGGTPAAGALSLPLLVYRGLMLLWALWLASRLVRWTGWAWRCFGEGGLWRRPERPGWLQAKPGRSAPAPKPGPDPAGPRRGSETASDGVAREGPGSD
jgi:hypothetical protein